MQRGERGLRKLKGRAGKRREGKEKEGAPT
jgi:hypothetical protein